MTIRVLLVDDSRVIVTYIQTLLQAEPDIEALAPAYDGLSAVKRAESEQPDVILMDIQLPILNGIQAIERIMASSPCPIVVLSGHLDNSDHNFSFDALKAGAVEVLRKPDGLEKQHIESFRKRLLRSIKVMSQACVVRRWDRKRHTPNALRRPDLNLEEDLIEQPRLLAIGSSTGGPAVLFEVLKNIPKPYPLPILIVQHIIVGFEQGLADWLMHTGHQCCVAEAGQEIESGQVYLAPAHVNMTLQGTQVVLLPPAEDELLTPSVDVLFQSLARKSAHKVIACLMTGMGQDGAAGLKALKDQGALTITQSRDSCVVDSMPRSAEELNAHCQSWSPHELSRYLNKYSHRLAATGDSSQ